MSRAYESYKLLEALDKELTALRQREERLVGLLRRITLLDWFKKKYPPFWKEITAELNQPVTR